MTGSGVSGVWAQVFQEARAVAETEEGSGGLVVFLDEVNTSQHVNMLCEAWVGAFRSWNKLWMGTFEAHTVDGQHAFRTSLKPRATTIGWYLQGNRHSRVS